MTLQDTTKSIKANSATITIQKNNTTVKQIKHMQHTKIRHLLNIYRLWEIISCISFKLTKR